ncbi:MAG: OsmC family protein [Thermoanaerobaculia bacterium]
MSVLITGKLVSPTATELDHDPSHVRLLTQAPKDNGGDGSSFSPTDLCAASLACCATTTLSLFAKRAGIPLTGVTFSVEKHMTAEPPRRIARLVTRYTIDSPCSDEDYAKLVNAAKTCPVRRSLHPDVAVEETFARA